MKLRPLLDNYFNVNDEFYLDENNRELEELLAYDKSSLNDLLWDDKNWLNVKRRSFFSSSERVDKNKGKRVNKNMFSSGLQGVWGVPGKK